MPSEVLFEGDRYAREFARDGYFIRDGVISDVEVERLQTAVARIPYGAEVRRRRGVYGVRNLLEICPDVEELARQTKIRQFVTPVLGERAFAVRAIYFDKVPGSNWSLFWHQDNVISVARGSTSPVTSAGRTRPACGRCSRLRNSREHAGRARAP